MVFLSVVNGTIVPVQETIEGIKRRNRFPADWMNTEQLHGKLEKDCEDIEKSNTQE